MNTKVDQQNCAEKNDYCKYGAKTLLSLLPTLEKQIEGVKKGEDIEYLHKMRVTSRRIRAAMPLFKGCYQKKQFRKWLNEIKRITKFLGEARDLDVQIIFLQGYMKSQPSLGNDSGVKQLFDCLTSRRAEIQVTVVNELDELNNSGVLEGIKKASKQIFIQTSNEHPCPQDVIEEASDRISKKLDDFLSMENCVHKKDDILCHHQMRIRAKWLRYTMEAFSPVYEENLSKEIKLVKCFQDVLGEMHDCDVWSQGIPKFMDKLETEDATQQKSKEPTVKEEKTLSELLQFVKGCRKKYYIDFVKLWDGKITHDIFEQLKKTTTGMGLINSENATRVALLNPEAKIAVLADVHGNLHALKAVIDDANRRGIGIFLNAGDLTGFGVFPNEVIKLLNLKRAVSVIGNFDLEALEKHEKGNSVRNPALKYTQKELSKPCATYLRSLPRKITFEVAGKKLLMTHGNPSAIHEHIYHNTSIKRLRELVKIGEADIIIVGHSHEQFLTETEKVSFINPGSVGRPYDGNPQAAYAIVGFNPFCVEFIRVDYSIKAAAQAMRKKKLPESFAQMLLRGLSFDAINKEDRFRKLEMEQNCLKMTESSRNVAQKYHQDTNHSEQVRRIALKIFEGLKDSHRLDSLERCWLECAAILHDIGLSMETNSHNKNSLKLILDDTQVPFSSVDRRIIGSIARYHRKGFPKEKHYNLAHLSKETKLKVKILSSILRVADGLDFTHQSIVDSIEVNFDSEKISIECVIHSNPNSEEQAVNKKKGLLEKVFGRKLVLTWRKN
jgi:putative phosphoesterase